MTPSRIFYRNSHVHRQAIITLHGKEAAHTLKLSHSGRFLAVGNDEGLLEIYMLHDSVWRRFGIYKSGTSIRALAWHPSEDLTIFCGSANGSLHRITMQLDGSYVTSSAIIPGYIHSLQLSPDGSRLAIGHGRSVSIVKDPFMGVIEPNELGKMARLNVSLSPNVQSLSEYKFSCGIFFASSRIVIIPFLGTGGITAYSLNDYSSKWSIQLRDNTFLGSAAISPSGEQVAVMNIRTPPKNLIVNIIFVDEDTVAVGHSDGYVAFATFGVSEICGTFALDDDNYRAPVQAITFGLVNHQPHIFAVIPAFSPWMRTHGAIANTIHVGLIQNNDESGIGEIDSTLDDQYPSTRTRPLTMYSANTFHFTTMQVAMLLLVTISSTLYGKYLLSTESHLPPPHLQVAAVTEHPTNSASETLVNPSSQPLFLEGSPTSPAHPFYAFTLTGMVTGSASIALPTVGSNSA
ncbi:hypothetical protein JR316_0012735 [Psilocybe cubensis]|uniref:Uncharacterized protein n=1 Tax=Psilocybe cubensis TaxID=181762 RepID=A0ACB8GJB2_PSICU|nr:hypothetical protein JR316_0012735 [Psilocybe cubensis]KAH9475618.1 hypothetical protein JR316_0012735 [Psilocybe cubensis]